MQIRRYEANSVQEAMARIKKELGPDAVVLSSKRLKGAGSSRVEVVAARDIQEEQVCVDIDGCRQSDVNVKTEPFQRFQQEIQELKTLVRQIQNEKPLVREFAELRQDMGALFDVLGMRHKDAGFLSQIYCKLIANGVSRSRACRLIEASKHHLPTEGALDYETTIRRFSAMIAGRFAASRSRAGSARIKVFAGPTGAGKTTTLAKLAAHYALEKKSRVGVITTDTYRIAATEQLRVYTDIIGVPLAVAPEKELFSRSVRQFSDKDVILVDTPGRSRKDQDALTKLKDSLGSEAEMETSLLLSLSSSREHLLDAAVRYEVLDYRNIVFTKTDECTRFGFIYDVLDQAEKPVLYVTTGQNVPQDIEASTPDKLAEWILS